MTRALAAGAAGNATSANTPPAGAATEPQPRRPVRAARAAVVALGSLTAMVVNLIVYGIGRAAGGTFQFTPPAGRPRSTRSPLLASAQYRCFSALPPSPCWHRSLPGSSGPHWPLPPDTRPGHHRHHDRHQPTRGVHPRHTNLSCTTRRRVVPGIRSHFGWLVGDQRLTEVWSEQDSAG